MPEVAVRIHQVGVAGEVPAMLDILLLALVAKIAAAGRAAHRKPPDGARRRLATVLVDHLGLIAGHHATGRSAADLRSGRADEDVQHLGCADPVHDADAGCFEPGIERRLGKCFTGRHALA